MIESRTISSLRDNLDEVERLIDDGKVVYIAKNGSGKTLLWSEEQVANEEVPNNGIKSDDCYITEEEEQILDETEDYSRKTNVRYTLDEAFKMVRRTFNGSAEI